MVKILYLKNNFFSQKLLLVDFQQTLHPCVVSMPPAKSITCILFFTHLPLNICHGMDECTLTAAKRFEVDFISWLAL